VFAPFTTTAKEEILSPFPLCCADPALASCMVNLEKPHQGVAGKNPALHQGITWSNSTTALGLRRLGRENRVRSRCTGKERDSESGLDMFCARYYGSSGRFMTPDWTAKPTDVPYAEFGNPQSLNLYSYIGNNPMSRVDTDGHDCKTVGQHTWCWNRSAFKSLQDAENTGRTTRTTWINLVGRRNSEGMQQKFPFWRSDSQNWKLRKKWRPNRRGKERKGGTPGGTRHSDKYDAGT
jgi:RHS repeat-associated protein